MTMIGRRAFLLGGLSVISSKSSAATGNVTQEEFWVDGAVELHIAERAGADHRPLVLFIHGFQDGPNRPGALEIAAGGTDSPLARLAERWNIVAAALSQPGFGRSAGPPDFCGPRTQAAVRAALAALRSRESVDPARIALLGVSRGAVTSALVAAQEPTLAGAVLIAGHYDIEGDWAHLPSFLRNIIEREAGSDQQALQARTGIAGASRITCPVLLIHGRQDDRASPDQAERFAAALRSNGRSVELALLDAGHSIPQSLRWPHIERFLRSVLAL